MKVRPKEVIGSVFRLAIDVTKGKNFNWSLFLLNIFLQDCSQGQDDENHSFHFLWMLILIAFMAWREPPNTYFPQTEPGARRASKYSSLSESNNQIKKKNNAIVFHEYYNMLVEAIEATPRIATEVINL